MENLNTKNSKQIKISFWVNGKNEKHIFSINLKQRINNLKKLKEYINLVKHFTKHFEKMKIFNEKGMEIDDTDIEHFTNNELLYLSIDGSNFNVINYVNQFQIIKPIKSGGYGEVLLAKNIITNNLVSIKKIDLQGFSTDDLYNISREALYLSSLIHKNIIKMYCSYTYNNCLYNVMDFAEGGELTQLINSSENISEKKIKDIFKQIQEGVKFIHGKNVIHRDLKPNNILFLDKEKNHVVIIDFGISGISNGLNREIIKAGTFKFTPPEVLSRNNYQSSNKIDIWALGVILYLMIFKTYPFNGENNKEILKKVEKEELTFPNEYKIKKSLAKLLKEMFEKNPKKRIDINDSLFDLWYNDESDDYEIFSNDKKEIKFRIIPQLNNEKEKAPSYLRTTKSISSKSSCLNSFRKNTFS